jgi:polar amino acid transport system permease protein
MRQLQFGDLIYIIGMLRWTLVLWISTMAGGAVGGMLLALARSGKTTWLRLAATGFVRFFQGTPLLIQLLFLFFVPTLLFGWEVNALLAAIAAMSLHASAHIGEILRGCIASLPKGQTEAARALGLGYVARIRYVILPQAIRISLPALVGFSVMMVKATSLTSVLGFVEITKAAQSINAVTIQPLIIFGTVAAAYFAVCWPLSFFARRLELRLAR